MIDASMSDDGRVPHTLIKELSRRHFARWLLPAFAEWVAILLLFTIGFTAHHWLVWCVIIVLLGSRQHALGVLGHDGAHFTAAQNKRLNDAAAALLCFWPCMTTLGDFRRFHNNHHRYFQTELDPELVFKNHMSARQWQTPVSRRDILLHLLGDFMGLSFFEALKSRKVLLMTGELFKDAPGRPQRSWWQAWVGPVSWFGVATLALYETGYLFALVIWFASLATSFWAFFRLRTWTEHGGTTSTHRIKLFWWQKLLITPHGSWSHYEHHHYPSVPFWARHKICEPGARTVSLWQLLGSFGSS